MMAMRAPYPIVSLGEMRIDSVDVETRNTPDGIRVVVIMRVRDVANHDQTVGLGFARTAPHDMTEHVFARFVRRTIMEALANEVDQWLRFDGTLIGDPHPEVKR